MAKTILIRPIISEKMTKLQEQQNKFTFLVGLDANKIEIKEAVEQSFNVTVEAVNTMIRPGKHKTRYTKAGILSGKSAATKRAIVTLAEGDTIDFYEDV